MDLLAVWALLAPPAPQVQPGRLDLRDPQVQLPQLPVLLAQAAHQLQKRGLTLMEALGLLGRPVVLLPLLVALLVSTPLTLQALVIQTMLLHWA